MTEIKEIKGKIDTLDLNPIKTFCGSKDMPHNYHFFFVVRTFKVFHYALIVPLLFLSQLLRVP